MNTNWHSISTWDSNVLFVILHAIDKQECKIDEQDCKIDKQKCKIDKQKCNWHNMKCTLLGMAGMYNVTMVEISEACDQLTVDWTLQHIQEDVEYRRQIQIIQTHIQNPLITKCWGKFFWRHSSPSFVYHPYTLTSYC